MSSSASAQIQTLSTAIADIYLPSDESNTPRAIGDILRPLQLELRRARLTGEPPRAEIIDRFCKPPSPAQR